MNIKRQATAVSAFEAKTHLSQLLQEVEQGKTITITKRGRPVARLVPIETEQEPIGTKEILDGFKEIRDHIKENVNIVDLINEGRKR